MPEYVDQHTKLFETGQGEIRPCLRLDNTAISRHRPDVGAYCRVYTGGMIIKRGGLFGSINTKGKKRGKVQGFSGKSRRRMNEINIQVDWRRIAADGKRARSGRGFFISLTYHHMPESPERLKADLEAFKKRMYRGLGFQSAIWKLEPQERGVPHFHIAMFFEDITPWIEVARYARKSWTDITDSKVVDVQTIYAIDGDYGRLMRYMSKYLGKKWSGNQEWGRCWGVWFRPNLPMGHDPYLIDITAGSYIELCRRIRKWGRMSPYLRKASMGRMGMLLFGADERIVQLLRGLDFVEITS